MWIFFALASRLLWSGCSAIDQILTRSFPRKKTKAVMMISAVLMLPFSLLSFMLSDDINISTASLLWAGGGVAAYLTALVPYYRCIAKEEAYNIVPFLELTPVLLIIIAMILRHEVLSMLQFCGAVLVIICGFLFSWDFKQSKIKTHVMVPMLASCLFFATYQFSIRSATAYSDAWNVVGLILLANSLLGWISMVIFPKVRRIIVTEVVRSGGKTVLLALGTNLLSFLATASLAQAFIKAPTTGHVAGLSGTQPLFSFLLAVILARMLPRHFERFDFDLETKVKLLLVILIFIGVYLLVAH